MDFTSLIHTHAPSVLLILIPGVVTLAAIWLYRQDHRDMAASIPAAALVINLASLSLYLSFTAEAAPQEIGRAVERLRPPDMECPQALAYAKNLSQEFAASQEVAKIKVNRLNRLIDGCEEAQARENLMGELQGIVVSADGSVKP